MPTANVETIASEAAAHTSKALSLLLGKDVHVRIQRVGVKKVQELCLTLGPDEVVTVVLMPITGDAEGVAYLILPRDTADAMSELLTGGQTEYGQATEMAKSAFKELGNIVAGAYLTVLSNRIGAKLIEHLPEIACDMFGAVVSQIAGHCSTLSTKVLVTEVQFSFLPDRLRGYLLLAFDWEASHRLFGLPENEQIPVTLKKPRAGRSA